MAKKAQNAAGAGAPGEDDGSEETTAIETAVSALEKECNAGTSGAKALGNKSFAASGFNPGALWSLLVAGLKLFLEWKKQQEEGGQ